VEGIPKKRPVKKALPNAQVVQSPVLDSIEIAGVQNSSQMSLVRQKRHNAKPTKGLKSKLALAALVLASPFRVGAQSVEEQLKTFNDAKIACGIDVVEKLGGIPPRVIHAQTGFLPCMDKPNGVVENFSQWPNGTFMATIGSQKHTAQIESFGDCKYRPDPYFTAITSALKRTDIPSLPAAQSSVKKWRNVFGQTTTPLSTFQFPFKKENGLVVPNTSPNAWNKGDNPLGQHAIIIAVDDPKDHCKGARKKHLLSMVEASAPLMPPRQKIILENPTKKEFYQATAMAAKAVAKNPYNPQVLIGYTGHNGVVEDLSAPKNQKLKETEGALTGGLLLGNGETLYESDLYRALQSFPEGTPKLVNIHACYSGAWLNTVPPNWFSRIRSYFFT